VIVLYINVLSTLLLLHIWKLHAIMDYGYISSLKAIMKFSLHVLETYGFFGA